MRDERFENGDRVIYLPEELEAEVLGVFDITCIGCVVNGQAFSYLARTHQRGCPIQKLNAFQWLTLKLSNGKTVEKVKDNQVKPIL